MMSDYGRFESTSYRDRDRRFREDEQGRGSFFWGGRDDRGEDRDRNYLFRGRSESDYGRGDRGFDRDRGREFGRQRGFDEDNHRNRHRAREENRFGYDDRHDGLPIDETSQLIASNKVEGTPVYGREGERLGTIYNFMVDKRSGQVEYAVMSYGGFLGMGQRYYPMPWRILTYDTREGGYRVDLDYRDMERAPSFGRNDEPRFNREYGRRVHSWYGLDY
jgi:hypothetical protein